jgi:hypothetical protein
MKDVAPPPIVRLSAAKQRQLDALLEKNQEGTITTIEKTKLDKLVSEAEQLMVDNAKRLADFARRTGDKGPIGSTPVTVWVRPTSVDNRHG